jgi:biopolymer transport protein ExbD
MKPTFFRLITLALSLAIGLAVSYSLANPNVADPHLPAFENRSAMECANQMVNKYVVISVPDDDEFYIGKQRVELSQISATIARRLSGVSFSGRVVYIKSAAKVRFETLDLVLHAAKQANLNRIEFVLDKKKARINKL